MSNCRRDLPTAVAHARKATELTPDNTGNKDTLAEALFRAGEKDKAIEIMRDLVSKTRGTNPYYRRQLARFQTGDVTTAPSEVPQEANGEEE
jgi:predicted Zn-dependent protease